MLSNSRVKLALALSTWSCIPIFASGFASASAVVAGTVAEGGLVGNRGGCLSVRLNAGSRSLIGFGRVGGCLWLWKAGLLGPLRLRGIFVDPAIRFWSAGSVLTILAGGGVGATYVCAEWSIAGFKYLLPFTRIRCCCSCECSVLGGMLVFGSGGAGFVACMTFLPGWYTGFFRCVDTFVAGCIAMLLRGSGYWGGCLFSSAYLFWYCEQAQRIRTGRRSNTCRPQAERTVLG